MGLWEASLAVAAVLLGLCALAEGQAELGCITRYDPSQDYFGYLTGNVTGQPFVLPLNLTIVDTANDFAVSYGRSYKIARNSLRQLNYVLYLCGTPEPNKLQLGLNDSDLAFQIPITNYSIDGTVPVAYLELLGVFSGLKAIAADGDYVSSPCLLQYESQGLVTEIDYSDPSVTDQYDVAFVAPSPSPFSDNRTNVAVFDATLDPGPLKRAEWIKFIATFFNLEERANNVFDTISNTYQCLNGSMKNAPNKPTVAWINFYGDTWSFNNATYKRQLSLDAGGMVLSSSVLTNLSYNTSIPAELKAFQQILKVVDLVIDETYATSPPDYTLADFAGYANISLTDASFPFLANKRIWRNDKRIGKSLGLDWLEGAIAQPQIVLHDLLGMLYPSLNYGTPYYFRNLALNETVVMTAAEGCARTIADHLDPTVFPCPLTSSPNNSTTGGGGGGNAAPHTGVPTLAFALPLLLLLWTSSF